MRDLGINFLIRSFDLCLVQNCAETEEQETEETLSETSVTRCRMSVQANNQNQRAFTLAVRETAETWW